MKLIWKAKIIPLRGKIECDISPYATFRDDVVFAHGAKGLIVGEYVFEGKTLIFQNATCGGITINGTSEKVVGSSKGNLIISAGAYFSRHINIGKNVVVGANAVVTKDVPDNCVVIGNNRIIKKSEKEMMSYFESARFLRKHGRRKHKKNNHPERLFFFMDLIIDWR